MYRIGRQMLVAGVMVGLFMLGVRREARAQDAGDTPPAPLTLTNPAALPFSETELQLALLARLLPSSDEPGQVAVARVEAAGPGAVSVRIGEQTRVVVLGDRTGTAAARVVALVVAELMSARSTSSSATPIGAPAPRAEQIRATPTTAAAEPSAAAERAWRLSVTGGVSKGTGSDELAAAALDTDLVIRRHDRRWGLSPSAGLSFMPTRNGGTFQEVSFVSAVARLLGGATWGPVDLFAGPFVSAYAIGGATAHRGFLFGGEAMARVAAPLSRTLRLAVEARLDGYANRVRALSLGGGDYATPRVGMGIGLGLAWDWTS